MIVGAVGGSVADKPAAPTRTRASTCESRTHLSPVSEHATEIRWYAVTVDQARVQAWTCSRCDDEQYELCVLGGMWFLRRTGRGVHETVRDTRAEAERLWWLLVAGGAR